MTTKERKVLQEMYRALEELPGKIRRGEDRTNFPTAEQRIAAEVGAERARCLVYAWLREANMIPHGGR